MDKFVCDAHQSNYGWFYFEAFDEPWKSIFYEGDNRWETEWGIFNRDRTIKRGIAFPRCK
jgi:exo-beta-1,3-glucanase (GH17 family)